MKISSILKMTAAIMAILFLITGWSVFSLQQSITEQKHTVEKEKELSSLAMQLQQSSDYLTNEVRAYVQFGEQGYYNNYWREVNETKTREKVVKRLKDLKVPNELLDLVERAQQNSNKLVSLENQAMKAVKEGKLEEARKFVFGYDYNNGKKSISGPLIEFQKKIDKWASDQAQSANAKVKTGLFVMIISSVLVVIATSATFVALFRRIRPLTKLNEYAVEITQGNLTVEEIATGSKDEVSQLTQSFNGMVASLKRLLNSVHQASENVASSSEQLLASAEQTSYATQQVSASIEEMASGAELQLKQVQESAASIQEVSKGIQLIAETSSLVSKASEDTNKKSEIGQISLKNAIAQMKEIEKDVDNTSKSIQTLDQRSKEIENIVVAITDISAQTNLLALNAAIEAARAGEHGKGFAVVADEVRKLAEQSSSSAQQIAEIIKSIQNDTVHTVNEMKQVTNNVATGVSVIQETGLVFNEILEATQKVSSQIQEVSAVSDQMSVNALQISASFEEVQSITETATAKTQNVAGLAQEQHAAMEEITASSNTLSQLAVELRDELNKFKY
ncbi:methyl-accepting chemotaxis protein [Peribacillus sp. SCS-155]|uniref:methyl-accepting chemotaxis protein n=1 Tax=Peribacillus sedimenti TaxID=3115297 RepID=UPI0039065A4E